MVRAIAGPGLPARVVEMIATRSEEIPLLVEELIATHTKVADGDLPVPEIVRATVRQRMLGFVSQPKQLSFRHALLQDAIYADIP
jgi:hypothetical protein